MTETRALPTGALARLRAQLDLLTPALRRVAACVLEHPSAVIYQTVTELAEASGSGEATVIRMCRDLGFKGFQDFKLALAADLAATPRQHARDPKTPAELIAHAAQQATVAIEETRKVLGSVELDQALTALAGAPHVLVTGQGASGVTALDFAYKLLRLGVHATATLDPHLAAMHAVTLPRGAVVIGISRSGSTIDTVHCLRLARESEAFTIAVTHRAKSPIALLADCVLFTASPEDPLGGGAVSSKIGQLLVLEALFTGLGLRLPGAERAIRATATAVVDKSY